jgi:acetylornithine deacetylase/succinyl-diaminopimelate desuccinylase-like protein
MGERVAVADRSLGAEAVGLLSEVLRIDTSNPPGNERPVQELLAARLRDAGFACEFLGEDPRRPNLVARLPGEAPGPTLCLLGHADTVPADPREWSFDPWAGDVVDGFVRGRGAQDMKDQVAAEVAAAASLGRSGWRPARGELKVVVTVDEEAGWTGAKWLCEAHPDAARADLVVNEGGGKRFEVGGRRYYTVAVGEKGICRMWLRARGVAGHASVPALGDNALLRLAPALLRLTEQPPLEPTEEGVEFLSTVLGDQIDPAAPDALGGAVERLRDLNPPVTAFLAEPMLRVTVAPTMVRASEKENVIPSRAEALLNCRLPPGVDASTARGRVAELLGPLAGEVELDVEGAVVGTRSSLGAELLDAISAWLADADPGATPVPIVMPGFSDSHWFRSAFGAATVYGFSPQRELDLAAAAQLIHGADERAAVADVELAASFFADLPRRLLG